MRTPLTQSYASAVPLHDATPQPFADMHSKLLASAKELQELQGELIGLLESTPEPVIAAAIDEVNRQVAPGSRIKKTTEAVERSQVLNILSALVPVAGLACSAVMGGVYAGTAVRERRAERKLATEVDGISPKQLLERLEQIGNRMADLEKQVGQTVLGSDLIPPSSGAVIGGGNETDLRAHFLTAKHMLGQRDGAPAEWDHAATGVAAGDLAQAQTGADVPGAVVVPANYLRALEELRAQQDLPPLHAEFLPGDGSLRVPNGRLAAPLQIGGAQRRGSIGGAHGARRVSQQLHDPNALRPDAAAAPTARSVPRRSGTSVRRGTGRPGGGLSPNM